MKEQMTPSRLGPVRQLQPVITRRVGNFLWTSQGGNTKRYDFLDTQQNRVSHGGEGDLVVTVRIKEALVELFKPRLISYLRSLVGRNKEELHTFGWKKFRGITIDFSESNKSSQTSSDFEVVIDVGSGSYYHQDEIAYEVMAALSGIPALKAVSPLGEYGSFVRHDDMYDGLCIKYCFEYFGLNVEFVHGEGLSEVVVSMDKKASLKNKEKFKKLMCDFVAKYVEERTLKKLPKEEILLSGQEKFFHQYQGEGSTKRVEVDFLFGKSSYFSVTVPYSRGFKEPFARVRYAERLMKMLSKEFKIPQ